MLSFPLSPDFAIIKTDPRGLPYVMFGFSFLRFPYSTHGNAFHLHNTPVHTPPHPQRHPLRTSVSATSVLKPSKPPWDSLGKSRAYLGEGWAQREGAGASGSSPLLSSVFQQPLCSPAWHALLKRSCYSVQMFPPHKRFQESCYTSTILSKSFITGPVLRLFCEVAL